jgi:hypothetical protein
LKRLNAVLTKKIESCVEFYDASDEWSWSFLKIHPNQKNVFKPPKCGPHLG